MSGTKHLTIADVVSKTSAVAQFLNSGASSEEGIRRKVREFLAQRAKKLHSQDLELLAEKLEADPFVKVKKMIEQMITRLLEEAKEDADHEGFCDKEMGESKITRNKLTGDIDALSAAVEDGKAQIILLTQDSKKLTAEVAELDAAMIEATKLRNTEKEKNTEVVEDSKQAIGAVEAATAILKDFYKKASIATALVQGKPKFQEGMQTFGSTFTGQQEEAGGVMALLEVISADFSNLKADTLAAESEAAKAYDDFMTDAKRNKASKMKAIEMDEADKIAAESKLQADTADLKSTQDQLLAADRYYQTLVPQCLDKGQTFKERTTSRAEEIASLKEALRILSDEQ
jgi:microcompartment protein CcmL/EutN